MKYKKFDALNISSKFAICGLPIRVDTYKNCSFGCEYCFSNNRKIMEFGKDFQIADLEKLENKLNKVFVKNNYDKNNFLDVLLKQNLTWHCGGMSDPFQPIEKELSVTKDMIEIASKYNQHILFSTKTDSVYDANINPELHTFQLSVTNVNNRKDIEPNVSDITTRYNFYRYLKSNGFKVGIRIQPFIPNVTTLDIVKMFSDVDNFTLEGIKLVPQNEEHVKYMMNLLNLHQDDFTQMGLLNLLPCYRLYLYKPFIEYFESHSIPYSIADNDLHYIGTNRCCCGDSLVNNSTNFNTTAMIKKYGINYSIDNVISELDTCGCTNCTCNHLFTSNRQEGCKTVKDFYLKRFDRESSPFSPKFLFVENKKNNLFM